MTDIRSHWTNFKRRGLHYFNKFLPDVTIDPLTSLFRNFFLMMIFLSTVMMIVGEGGILYSSLRLPLLWNLKLLAGDPQPDWIHPEQGMHWTTVLMYSWMIFFLLLILPKRGFRGFHTLSFSFCMFISAFVFPFEWIYVPLLDIFHNLPVEGTMSTFFYGWWRPFPILIMNSVIGRNGIMALGLLFAHWIAVDNYHNNPKGFIKFKYNINKKSALIAFCFIFGFIAWICLPMIIPNQFKAENHKGTTYFPQTIYVWYAHSSDTPWDLYDIVREEWLPNGTVSMIVNYTSQDLGIEEINVNAEPMSGIIIRVIQLPIKACTVVWVMYTFLPKPVKKDIDWKEEMDW